MLTPCIGLGGTDGVVALDLVNFQHFRMDTTTWKATIGAGTRLGEVDKKLIANGNRAMAHGVCPDVGIGGHATIVRDPLCKPGTCTFTDSLAGRPGSHVADVGICPGSRSRGRSGYR